MSIIEEIEIDRETYGLGIDGKWYGYAMGPKEPLYQITNPNLISELDDIMFWTDPEHELFR